MTRPTGPPTTSSGRTWARPQAEECDDPRTRQLLIDWVRYQWKHGEFESCLSLASRLETLWTPPARAR